MRLSWQAAAAASSVAAAGVQFAAVESSAKCLLYHWTLFVLFYTFQVSKHSLNSHGLSWIVQVDLAKGYSDAHQTVGPA